MKTIEQIFEAAKAGSLWAGNLIPNHADSGRKLENRTPIDNSLIGYIADGSEQDIDAAVRAARSAFSDDLWAGKSPSEKRAVLLRWAQLIEEHAEELAALDCIDAGKPISECINTDMPATIETFYFYAEYVDKAFGRVAPTGNDALGLIMHEPVGVVGVVLPWNFPAQMFAWKVAPALASADAGLRLGGNGRQGFGCASRCGHGGLYRLDRSRTLFLGIFGAKQFERNRLGMRRQKSANRVCRCGYRQSDTVDFSRRVLEYG